MFRIVEEVILELENPSASIMLEYYSLEIKFNALTGTDITDKLHHIELKMPRL